MIGTQPGFWRNKDRRPAVHYTQAFLLAAGVLIEISIVMIPLSRVLKYRANRWANIVAAIFLTVVQLVTLFVRTPTLVYVFFSIIMVATTAIIAWYAWKWHNTEVPA